jgi:hypothetical protein
VKLNKTLEALLKGYLFFRVNGKTYFRYNTALKARKRITRGDVFFDGWNIYKALLLKPWVGFYRRVINPTVNMKFTKEERSLLHFACGKLLEDKGLSNYAKD